jgi:hypothetical protein
MEDNKKEKDELDNAIHYFQIIVNNNISNYSQHKMGATFIGIKTNISGTIKLHTYILLFPFRKSEVVVPYCNPFPNLFLKDVCFYVDKSFYLWLYEEMKTQKSMVVLTLDSTIMKVVPGMGDAIINVDIQCNEKKEWMELEYEAWYEKQIFNNRFTINITNPFLYMVPFPVKPIILKTLTHHNNYVAVSH